LSSLIDMLPIPGTLIVPISLDFEFDINFNPEKIKILAI
jgi:hypothetical protein